MTNQSRRRFGSPADTKDILKGYHREYVKTMENKQELVDRAKSQLKRIDENRIRALELVKKGEVSGELQRSIELLFQAEGLALSALLVLNERDLVIDRLL